MRGEGHHSEPVATSDGEPAATAEASSSRSPTGTDWWMMLAVAAIGGSSFAAIAYAVETAPPPLVAAGRLWVAAGFMAAYAYATGRRAMPVREGGRFNRAWGHAAGVGLIGYALPLVMIPWAQQSVSSLLAGIYIAFMPIATVVLAALFADEPLTRRKALGFAGGTLGVLILIGPAALSGVLDASVLAQAVLLLAVTGYAVGGVLMRRAPAVPARSFALGFLLSAAVMATPPALAAGWEGVSLRSWLAILYLGLFPTGLTAVFIILVVRRVGAGFLSSSAYLSPIVAIALGVALRGEAVEPRYLLGLGAILVGMALAEPESARALLSFVRGGPRRGGR
jgi:drug/metabolite transporter (DMT)-like permease